MFSVCSSSSCQDLAKHGRLIMSLLSESGLVLWSVWGVVMVTVVLLPVGCTCCVCRHPFGRIAILKRPLNFFFSPFCAVIYQNLLHRRVHIAVSSYKLLFHQFCEKTLHITFNAFAMIPTSVIAQLGCYQIVIFSCWLLICCRNYMFQCSRGQL